MIGNQTPVIAGKESETCMSRKGDNNRPVGEQKKVTVSPGRENQNYNAAYTWIGVGKMVKNGKKSG